MSDIRRFHLALTEVEKVMDEVKKKVEKQMKDLDQDYHKELEAKAEEVMADELAKAAKNIKLTTTYDV
jgi:hypothetical protein